MEEHFSGQIRAYFKVLVLADKLYMIFITASVLNSAQFDSVLFWEKIEINSSHLKIFTGPNG